METKTALVTGSTSGMGLGVATTLAQKGYHVIMCGSRSKEDAFETITQVKSSALHTVHYVQANLKTEAGLVSLCKEVDSICPGGVDILVNNAGMQHVTPVEDCSLAKWNEVVAINLTAPFYLISHFVPRMKQKGWGRLINVSSRMGLVASANKSPYCSTKHGLVGMTKAVALETAPHGITCNAICPGWVDTPFVQAQVQNVVTQHNVSVDEAKKRLFCDSQPTGKPVQVSQIADLVLFLCSPGADSMTGTSLVMDGGTIAK
ncbi:D-beta-hydroxybutyrate dehydrogenase-like [Ylistrum balloti]|uniref:D-beta-hydroxybutyrate dehydrogenase-like n=1 Tax=Ylistrum balloti TaxID=509963 RepID=UPI002905D24D|nr:D-beta-hydroxybutyrate dehydrogenase-like [Ylistrum balloti]